MTATAERLNTVTPSPVDLSRCHQEPIHIPGAVQPHGVLLGLSEPGLTILQASRSAGDVLGVDAERLLGSDLGDALGEWTRSAVEEGLAAVGEALNPLRIPVVVRGETVVFDGVLHRTDGVAVLELENPRPEADSGAVDRLLDRHYRLIQETVASLARCETVDEIAGVVTGQVRSFTGFDRVMVYKFEEDAHGWVVAEDKADDLEPYLGLHYPATDIPEQARRLYASNWLRLISDVGYAPSPLVPAANPLTNRPLDLSKSVLRSVSPVHVQYLKNMGVGSSMSISLMRGDRLWGLIACHHRTAKYVPYAARLACVLFGTVLSAQIVAAEQNLKAERRVRKRELLATLLQDISRRGSVTRGLLDDPETLLALVDASGAAVSFAGDVSLVGQTPGPDRVEKILAHLDAIRVPDTYATDHLPDELPDARHDEATACGLLAARFPSGDYLLFFRPEVVRTVRWAGNPCQPATVERVPAQSEGGPPLRGGQSDSENRTTLSAERHGGRSLQNGASVSGDGETIILHPRASFAEWAETVRGRSVAWDQDELQLVQELRNALSVYLLRQEAELAKLNRHLAAKNEEMSQFLYTVSHDLKSPLVTCRGFIGLLREDLSEGRLDEIEDFARRVDDAASHMSRMIDDLLHLYRLGRSVRSPRPIDLRQVATDLREEYGTRLAEKGAELVIASNLPERIVADPVAFKRALDNLLTNALKYACGGPVKTLTLGGAVEAEEVRIFLRDHGPGVPAAHRERIFQLFQRLAPAGIEGSGVGLASVAKVMRLHGGRAWVEETPGGGATFWLAFPNEPQSWAAVGGPSSHVAAEEES